MDSPKHTPTKQESTPLLVNSTESDVVDPAREWVVRNQSCLGVVVIFINAFFLFSAMMADEIVAAAVPELSTLHFRVTHSNNTEESTMGIDSVVVGVIYSSSYIPSILFVLVGGVFASKIGVRPLGFISSLLLISGIVLFAMVETVWGKIVGRILFGLGLGPIEVRTLTTEILSQKKNPYTSFPSSS